MRGIRQVGLVVLATSVIGVARADVDSITVTKKQWTPQQVGLQQLFYVHFEGAYTTANAGPVQVQVYKATGTDPIIWVLWATDNAPAGGQWKADTPSQGAVPPAVTVRVRLYVNAVLAKEIETNVTYP